MENTPNNNHLNTGNGVNPTNTAAPEPASVSASAVPTATQSSSTVPTTPPPPMPVNITPEVVKAAAPTETPKAKKYIIAGVAGLALLTSIYIGYTFFKPTSDLTDTTTELSDLNNKLSAPSTETTDIKPEETPANKEKLNKVVNELKDQYKTPEAATSNPPGISIQLDAPKTDSSAPSTENPSQPDTSSNTSTPSTENPSQPDTATPETSDTPSIPR